MRILFDLVSTFKAKDLALGLKTNFLQVVFMKPRSSLSSQDASGFYSMLRRTH